MVMICRLRIARSIRFKSAKKSLSVRGAGWRTGAVARASGSIAASCSSSWSRKVMIWSVSGGAQDRELIAFAWIGIGRIQGPCRRHSEGSFLRIPLKLTIVGLLQRFLEPFPGAFGKSRSPNISGPFERDGSLGIEFLEQLLIGCLFHVSPRVSERDRVAIRTAYFVI